MRRDGAGANAIHGAPRLGEQVRAGPGAGTGATGAGTVGAGAAGGVADDMDVHYLPGKFRNSICGLCNTTMYVKINSETACILREVTDKLPCPGLAWGTCTYPILPPISAFQL